VILLLFSTFEPVAQLSFHPSTHRYRMGGVMVSVLSSAVGRGFESRSSQTKDYEIGICCFSAKHAALRRKIKDWLAPNQDNVSLKFTWSRHDIAGKKRFGVEQQSLTHSRHTS
jgi:hypothetical protein